MYGDDLLNYLLYLDQNVALLLPLHHSLLLRCQIQVRCYFLSPHALPHPRTLWFRGQLFLGISKPKVVEGCCVALSLDLHLQHYFIE